MIFTTRNDQPRRGEAVRNDRQVTYVPPVQIYEGEDAFQLIAEVPGADEKSTEVTVEKGVLTLTAKMASPKPEGAKLAYSEFSDGWYRRSFELSDAVDKQGIEATVANGVLAVRLPKAKALLPKKVPVVAG
jgi:HSP20 family molecular chaperone IbpA